MCVSLKAPSPPSPPPAPVPKPKIQVSGATTKQKAPAEASGRDVKMASTHARRRVGRGTLRIPLTSSGLDKTGLNLPTS